MTSPAEDSALEAEFDIVTGRLGIEVPPDLKAGVLRGYRGLREMMGLLREIQARDRTETTGG